MPSPKRFIAGAVCPRCGAMDRLMMHRDGDHQYRECIDCGFEDAQSLVEDAAPEPETRVNRRDPSEQHTVEPVVFFKAPADDSDRD
ncbi:hypothetical protein C8D92_103123 [Tamilnaduibacter salinus]|uniref:DNA-binding protein n=1 Tax=Tamilnaduibacter salinus TaxID=1484056 RepID=A0A2U1CY68_9GAMM|nr:YheV family putative zinc ribbon protein [Tamilnaduibacter salinus]PVY77438.1 hypothetical protein C8D92_103123 [Tamilnaduibacter salinus]